jgi:hypothetical protein|nr:MAG TPA: hypothetical protein [Caudoviricetes sp.]
MYEARQNKNSQSRIIKHNKQCSRPSHYLLQRLVLKYGGSVNDTINEDSEKLAKKQNEQRQIPVIDLNSDIESTIYDKMIDKEDIYIVSHARASIGNFPAVLEKRTKQQHFSNITGEQGKKNMSGKEIAQIISDINNGLKAKNKSMGKVKIEACMSSMRRSTKNSFWEIFRGPKNSLVDDIYKYLSSIHGIGNKDIHIEGNTGFSKGLELTKDLFVTDEKHTELGLLANILEILYYKVINEQNANKEYEALKKDAKHIVEKYKTELEYFKNYLIDIDKKYKDIDIIKSVNEIIENGKTQYGEEIIFYLSQYKGIDTSIYESFLYGLTEDEIWADLLYNQA